MSAQTAPTTQTAPAQWYDYRRPAPPGAPTAPGYPGSVTGPAPQSNSYPASNTGSTPAPTQSGTDVTPSTAAPTPAPTGDGTSTAPAVTKPAITQNGSATTTSSTTTTTAIQSAITQEVKTAMTHVMSNVPWMKFRVHAEPDLSVFQTDVVFQQALTQISQVAATSISHTITSEFTSQMQTLIQNITKTAATQISTTMVQLIQELITASTLTHCSTNAGGLIISGIPDCITGELVPYGDNHDHPNQKPKPKPEPHTDPVAPPNFDVHNPTPTTPDISKAGWIWTQEAASTNTPPGGARPFRKTFTAKTPVDHLCIDITCDNYYTLYVNGQLVGSGRDWTQIQRYEVSFPSTRTVTVAVYGVQDAIYVAQAGVLAAATVWAKDGPVSGVYTFVTDGTWKTLSNQNFPPNFMAPGFHDANWDNAVVEGPYGMPPWGALPRPTAFTAQNGPLTNLPGGVPSAPSAPNATVVTS